MKPKLTPAQQKELETMAKKSGTVPGEFLDLVAKGVREVAMPIPDWLWRAVRGRKKK